MTHLGSPTGLGSSVVRGPVAYRHLVGESPDLTQSQARTGGTHGLDDAHAPRASDGKFSALWWPCLVLKL